MVRKTKPSKEFLELAAIDTSELNPEHKAALDAYIMSLMLEKKKLGPQARAWEVVVKLLRLHFLQGNSHLQNRTYKGEGDWIDEQVIETLENLRNTSKKKKTSVLVSKVKGRGCDYP